MIVEIEKCHLRQESLDECHDMSAMAQYIKDVSGSVCGLCSCSELILMIICFTYVSLLGHVYASAMENQYAVNHTLPDSYVLPEVN